MKTYDLIVARRTIRKYREDREIPQEIMDKLLNAARLAPSASNMQPLKYMVIQGKEEREKLFGCTKWAGYLPPEVGTPKEGERPAAYILILADMEIRKTGYDIDIGAAAQNITLAALEEGIASCWIGALDRENIQKLFELSDTHYPSLVIALGYPAEESMEEPARGSIRYYKDEKGVLHVPKRTLEEVLVRKC